MSGTRSKIRTKRWVKPGSSLATGEMEWYQYLIQQASLQCRLFGKVAEFVYHCGESDCEVKASSWKLENGQIVLDDGNQIPINAIQTIYLL